MSRPQRDLPGRTAFEPADLRLAFGALPSAVVAVAAGDDADTAGPVGLAVSTFVPVSLEPALVMICLQQTSRTWRSLRTRPRLGCSVLAAQHAAVARALAARDGDRFAGANHVIEASGAVRIVDTPAFFDCSLEHETTTGDHVVAVLQVHYLDTLPVAPLVFHRSAFTTLATP